jgi:hypothetical protein
MPKFSSVLQIFHNYKKKLKEKDMENIKNEMREYLNLSNVIINEKYKRKIYSSINLTSYNKKEVVLDTWSKLKDNEIPSNEKTFEDELDELLMEENKEQLYNGDHQLKNNNFNDNLSDDTDDSNDSYTCLIQKIIKNKSNK